MTQLIPAAIVVVLVLTFAWRTRDRHVAAFAKAYLVPITDETIAPLRATVQRSRRIRWTCGAAAVIVYVTASTDNDVGFWGMLGALAIGFGVGSIIDELTRSTHSPRSTPRASLAQRSVRTYVERWVLIVLGGLVVMVGFEGWRALVVEQSATSWAPDWSNRQIGGLLGIVVLSLAVGAFAINRIAQRPAPADSADMQMLRHGIRVSGVVSVVGALLVVVGAVGFTMTSFTTGAQESEPYNWLHVAAVVIFGVGFYTGLMLSIMALPSGRWAHELPTVPDSSTSNASAA